MFLPSSGPSGYGALIAAFCLTLCLCLAQGVRAERATLLIPSRPSIEEKIPAGDGKAGAAARNGQTENRKDDGKAAESQEAGKPDAARGKAEAAAPRSGSQLADIVDSVNASLHASVAPQVIREELDLLIAAMDPFRHRGVPMDPLRLFTICRFDRNQSDPSAPSHREDRLGDIEEIRYLNQKAWGANVGLERPGLYHFSIETQPWWDQSEAGYVQHLVKVMVPVCGEDWGWHLPLGLRFEIVPSTRPFGLLSPALFAGKVLVNGKPAADIPVTVGRVNTENLQVPTPWHEASVVRTGADGGFAALLNRPGWWYCQASRDGAPLKGPDGQPSPLRLSTIFWLYVDDDSH